VSSVRFLTSKTDYFLALEMEISWVMFDKEYPSRKKFVESCVIRIISSEKVRPNENVLRQ